MRDVRYKVLEPRAQLTRGRGEIGAALGLAMG
jgi:hypothetical protein